MFTTNFKIRREDLLIIQFRYSLIQKNGKVELAVPKLAASMYKHQQRIRLNGRIIFSWQANIIPAYRVVNVLCYWGKVRRTYFVRWLRLRYGINWLGRNTDLCFRSFCTT